LNHERLNTGNCKKHGIAFGEPVLMSSSPSRSQICGQARTRALPNLAHSTSLRTCFGGWAVLWTQRWDEKTKIAREAAPRLAGKNLIHNI
jgi:hypothetical protein